MTTIHTDRATPNALQEAIVRKRKARAYLEMSAQIVSRVKEKYHVTQAQIAELLDVDQSYISRVERGERRLTILHLETLSKCVGMPMPVFLWQVLGPPPGISGKKRQILQQVESLLKRAYPDAWE